MILAIGAIGPFRSGRMRLHPFGFFTASLEASPPSEFSFGTIQDIENLLLVSQFGIFYNIGEGVSIIRRHLVLILTRLFHLGTWPLVYAHMYRAPALQEGPRGGSGVRFCQAKTAKGLLGDVLP
jgi:hypothetical protein